MQTFSLANFTDDPMKPRFFNHLVKISTDNQGDYTDSH